MRMAFLVGSLTGGGAERVAITLCEHINSTCEKEVSCDLIVLNKTGDYSYNGNLIYINGKYTHGNLFRKVLYHYFLYRRRLRQLKRQMAYDVVISFATLPNRMNLASKMDERCIISVRNYTTLNLPAKVQKKVRKLYRKADHIVAVSEVSAQDLISNFGMEPEKLSVIYNPYDIEGIRRKMMAQVQEKEKREFVPGKTIVAIGRISEQKAFWRLVKAVGVIKETVPDVRLLILGRELHGNEQTRLLCKLIEKYELAKNVHLLGFKKNPYPFLYNSDIYALCSKYEGFPNGMAEAMACGLPIVSINCLSGPMEILDPESLGNDDVIGVREGKYGILVKRYDNHESLMAINDNDRLFADAILELLQDENKRKHYMEQSRNRIFDFHVSKIIDKWIKLER